MAVIFHVYTHCKNTYQEVKPSKFEISLFLVMVSLYTLFRPFQPFYYYLILASWIHLSSMMKDRDKFGTRLLRFKVDFRIINALFYLHLYGSNHLGGAMVGMVTSSSIDHGLESRSNQTEDYKICIFCFYVRHTLY